MSDAGGPQLAAPPTHDMAIDTSKQWRHTYHHESELIEGRSLLVDRAIDNMPEALSSVLHTWAWQAHRKPGSVAIPPASLTPGAIAAAKLELLRHLVDQGIILS